MAAPLTIILQIQRSGVWRQTGGVGALAEEPPAQRDRPFTLQEFAKHEAREKYCSIWTLALMMSLTSRDR